MSAIDDRARQLMEHGGLTLGGALLVARAEHAEERDRDRELAALSSPVDEAIARLPAEYEAIGRARVSHLLDLEELASQWDEAARHAAREVTAIESEPTRAEGLPGLCAWHERRAYAASAASSYELCAAQLRAVLARPARPDASDHEDEGE